MTLEQMRFMYGLISDALTKLVQGGEEMDRLTEVFVARGGNATIAQLKADYPENVDEIQDFQDLVTDVTPIVAMLQGGLMKENGPERAVLMQRRGDA